MQKALTSFILVLPLLAGCGGSSSGTTRSVSLRPASSLVQVNGTVPVELTQKGYDNPDYSIAVVEEDGGTLVPLESVVGTVDGIQRLYAAPSKPGTYHLLGTVTEGGQVQTKTAEIQVVIEG